MANEDKDIVIEPNTGSTTENPKVLFTSADADTDPQTLTLEATTAREGSISISSDAGQLFSLSNHMSSETANVADTIFAANDLGGNSYFEVREDGNVRVASSGRKLMRYPTCPAFRVRRSVGGSGFTADAVATWDLVDYNNGGHFNNGDRFTAPHSGIYYFAAMLLSNQNSRMYFNFRVNGSDIYGTYVETYAGSQFQTGTATMPYYLRAGDFVQVYVRSFNAYGSSYANFSGFQIG